MRVIDWISPALARATEESFGGLGGWFGFDGQGRDVTHTWADYLDKLCADSAQLRAYAEALRASIVECRIWQPGDWHQGDEHGVPLFEDGTIASFSLRGWGDLLAAVWSTQLARPYCYMDFYYSVTPRRPADFEALASRGVV